MSEDWYLADDEPTSAESILQGSLKPVPLIFPAHEPDDDDIFEGEPDFDLFATSEFDNAPASPEQSFHGEAGAAAGQNRTDLDQNLMQSTQTLATASGGLGPGDAPFDENSNKCINLEAPSEPDVSEWKNGNDSSYLQVDSRTQPEQHDQQTNGWGTPHAGPRNAMRQKEKHLKELSGEPYRERGYGNYSYSSSASPEPISEDTSWIQPEDEDGQIDTKGAISLLHHDVRTELPKPADAIQQEKQQSRSQEYDRKRLHGADSNSGSTHPSLSHSWPRLFEVTPAGVQSHHPSIIARSPHKGMSRASSLASESGLDAVGELGPLTEEAICEKDILATTETSKVFHSLLSPAKVEPHSGVIDNDGLSSPFRRPDMKYSHSSSRSSPLRKLADSVDLASTLVVTEFSMPMLSDVPSRLDTPRPSTELEKPAAFDCSHALPDIPPMHISELETTQAQNGPQTDLQTLTQVADGIVKIKTPPMLLPSRIQATSYNSPPPDIPWQDPRVVPDVLEHYSLQAQSNDHSTAPLSTEVNTPPQASTSEPGSVERRTYDTLSKSGDSIDFAVPPAEDLSVSSPFTGLQDAIQASRGLREATMPKCSAEKDLTGTRGRAVSVSSKKEKSGSISSIPPAIGVQGEGIRVTKTRSKETAADLRQKLTKHADESKSITDDIPEVPKLPGGVLLDAAKVYPRSIKLTLSAKTYNEASLPTSKGLTSSQATSTIVAGTERHGSEEQGLPETAVSDLSTPPITHEQQLKVPKTRKAIASTKTPPKSTKTDSATDTALTPEHDRMDIDVTSPAHEPDQSQHQTEPHSQVHESATPSTKKRPAIRNQTPGRIQKSSARKLKQPARVTTYKPDQLADLLETGAQVGQSEKSTQASSVKSKPRSKTTPRKATPAPRKRKQDARTLDEEVPPIPPMPTTPKRTTKNVAGDGRLTPQSTGRGQPKTPLRRSPRLSGIEPGAGL